MDTDDLRAEISAVENEIVGRSSSVTQKRRGNIPWRLLIAALLLFIVVDKFVLHSRKSGAEADLNHMMQQARHIVVDFQHRYGQLPPIVPNAALRPYISMTKLGEDRFRLEGKLGDVTQEMEGP